MSRLKWCYQCQGEVSPSEFHKDSTRKGGLNNVCKSCKKIRDCAHYHRNPKPYKRRARLQAARIRRERLFRQAQAV